MLQTAQRTTKLKRKKRGSASLGETAANKTAPHERFLEAFRWMLLARTLEEKRVSLYRGGQITGGVYIGKGQEAVSVACGLFLEKGEGRQESAQKWFLQALNKLLKAFPQMLKSFDLAPQLVVFFGNLPKFIFKLFDLVLKLYFEVNTKLRFL